MPLNWVQRSNAFSGAFLFAITVFLWMPHMSSEHHGHDHGAEILPWGFWIVVGYFLQFALDSRSKGLEHGHIHVDHDHGVRPWPAFYSLLIHSVVEGIPLWGLDESARIPFAISLAVHNLPIAAILAYWLQSCHVPAKRIAWAVLGLSIAAPLGSLVGLALPLHHHGMEDFVGGLVVGIFLHVSSTILFEAQKDHKMPWRTWATVLLGLGAGYALSLLH